MRTSMTRPCRTDLLSLQHAQREFDKVVFDLTGTPGIRVSTRKTAKYVCVRVCLMFEEAQIGECSLRLWHRASPGMVAPLT